MQLANWATKYRNRKTASGVLAQTSKPITPQKNKVIEEILTPFRI